MEEKWGIFSVNKGVSKFQFIVSVSIIKDMTWEASMNIFNDSPKLTGNSERNNNTGGTEEDEGET